MKIQFFRAITFLLLILCTKNLHAGAEASKQELLKPYKETLINAMLENAYKRSLDGEKEALPKMLAQIYAHNPELPIMQKIQGTGLEPLLLATCRVIPFFTSDNLIDKLCFLIEKEASSIKMGMYHLTLPRIINALITAKNNNPQLNVELCLDMQQHNNDKDRETLTTLENNAIKVYLVGANKWNMHEKFVIFENNIMQHKFVWQGSYNFTGEQTHDGILLMQDEKIADIFSKRFNALKSFDKGRLSAIHMNASMPAVFFSPRGGLLQKLINLIDTETKAIKMAMHTFYPNEDISAALMRAAQKNIAVTIILNKNQFNNGDKTSKAPITKTVMHQFKDAGITIYSSTGPLTMHHKFFIFMQNSSNQGKSIVWEGSYNISKKAEELNCEDAILTEEQTVITGFNAEFSKLEQQAYCPSLPDEISSKRQLTDKEKKESSPMLKKFRQTTLCYAQGPCAHK